LRVHQADALRVDLCSLLPEAAAGERLRVVGNLPYNISTPLLFRFLDQADCIADLHLMLQKEVVDRIRRTRQQDLRPAVGDGAEPLPGGAGAQRRPRRLHPAPKVDSAVVRLTPLRPPPVDIADPPLHARSSPRPSPSDASASRNALRGSPTWRCSSRCGLDPGSRRRDRSAWPTSRGSPTPPLPPGRRRRAVAIPRLNPEISGPIR
jgi:16S rRNA (adenine1518-N6/adenine1519-N6)-dimethyltransferase